MSVDQEKLIAELVEKGLAGDMDEINAIEDRVLRGKVKSALAKAKRAAKTTTTVAPAEEKRVAETIADTPPSDNPNQKFGQIIEDTFQGSLDAELNDTHIQLKPDNWFEIAKWLKSEPSLHFDSLQCHTGMDVAKTCWKRDTICIP